MNDSGDQQKLGPCCICETYVGVATILMLTRRAPIAGHGWGCLVCDLPSDGAVAVLCDGCAELVEAGADPIFACRGWPGVDGRILYSELSEERFDHDAAAHRRDEEGLT